MARRFKYGKNSGRGEETGGSFSSSRHSRETGSSSGSSSPAPFIPELPADASDLHRRVELYEYQLRNLRHELEQIKMQSILEGLSETAPTNGRARRPAARRKPDFDLSLHSVALSAPDPDHPGIDALLSWLHDEPATPTNAESPAPDTLAVGRRHAAPGYTLPPPDETTLSLLAKLADSAKRLDIQKALIFHLSSKLDQDLNTSSQGIPPGGDNAGPADTGDDDTPPAAPPETPETAGGSAAPDEMFSFSAAVDMVMALEAELSSLRATIGRLEAAELENSHLKARNKSLLQQLYGIHQDIDEHFNTRLRDAFRKHTEKFAAELEEKDKSLRELSALAMEYEKRLKAAALEIKELDGELGRLREVNNFLKSSPAPDAAPPPPAPPPDSFSSAPKYEYTGRPFGIELRELTENVRRNPSFEALLRLRRLFLLSKRYDDGIRTLLELADQAEYRRLLPAVCVLVGELYLASGRNQEARYYFNNRLIEHDTLAQSLLRTIPYENIMDEKT